MKPSCWDTQLGVTPPLEFAAGQRSKTNNPSKKETGLDETGLDASHHTRISQRGGEKIFFLTSSFTARHSRNQTLS
jgi:hypothetical protein